jgi:hypothetical protein
MDPGYRSPLIDLFRRGEAERSVKMLAAQGALAPRAQEQVALLVLLSDDADPQIASQSSATIASLPEAPLRAFLARSDVSTEIRAFFAARGVEPAPQPDVDPSEPLVDTLTEMPAVADDGESGESRVLSSLPVTDRMKLALKGTREQRAQLIRDPNRMVSTAVLSSPKLNDSEIEAFAKMGNVSEDVLRIIGTNRAWVKNYNVALALARNAKTPPALSMQLLHRLIERDVKMLSTDRNVPEALRLAARRIVAKGR